MQGPSSEIVRASLCSPLPFLPRMETKNPKTPLFMKANLQTCIPDSLCECGFPINLRSLAASIKCFPLYFPLTADRHNSLLSLLPVSPRTKTLRCGGFGPVQVRSVLDELDEQEDLLYGPKARGLLCRTSSRGEA